MKVLTRLMTVGALAVLMATGAAGTALASTGDGTAVQPNAAVFYDICVSTSNLTDAGTNSKIEFRLRGSLGVSPYLELNEPGRNDFERGAFDCFNDIVLADLGTLSSVDVRFTVRGGDSGPAWHLAYVRVAAPGDPLAYFPHHRWFTVNETRNLPLA